VVGVPADVQTAEHTMTMTSETFTTGRSSMPGEVFVPDATPARRVVLILHGSAGVGPQYHGDIASFAEALVASRLPRSFRTTSRPIRRSQAKIPSARLPVTTSRGDRRAAMR
jgi:hypothetical protein